MEIQFKSKWCNSQKGIQFNPNNSIQSTQFNSRDTIQFNSNSRDKMEIQFKSNSIQEIQFTEKKAGNKCFWKQLVKELDVLSGKEVSVRVSGYVAPRGRCLREAVESLSPPQIAALVPQGKDQEFFITVLVQWTHPLKETSGIQVETAEKHALRPNPSVLTQVPNQAEPTENYCATQHKNKPFGPQ